MTPLAERLAETVRHEVRHVTVAHAVGLEVPAFVTWRPTAQRLGAVSWSERDDGTPADQLAALRRLEATCGRAAFEHMAVQVLELNAAGPITNARWSASDDDQVVQLVGKALYGAHADEAIAWHLRRVAQLLARPPVVAAMRCVCRLLAAAPDATLSGATVYGLLDADLGAAGSYYDVQVWRPA